MSVEDWAEIRRLHRAERMPIKVIARVVGCSKNTVKNALAAEAPPAYRRQARGSVVDAMSRGFGSCCRPARQCQPR